MPCLVTPAEGKGISCPASWVTLLDECDRDTFFFPKKQKKVGGRGGLHQSLSSKRKNDNGFISAYDAGMCCGGDSIFGDGLLAMLVYHVFALPAHSRAGPRVAALIRLCACRGRKTTCTSTTQRPGYMHGQVITPGSGGLRLFSYCCECTCISFSGFVFLLGSLVVLPVL